MSGNDDTIRGWHKLFEQSNQSSPEMTPFSTLPAGTVPGHRMIIGERKPPSITVPLPPPNAVWPPSGQVKFSGAILGGEPEDRVLIETIVLKVLHDRTDDVVELGHASGCSGDRIRIIYSSCSRS
jgi:hypothetical protein